MSVMPDNRHTKRLTAGFDKDSRMRVLSEAPFNLESSLDLLADPITPIAHFFLRNNHAIPTIAPAEWTLRVDGHVERPYTLGYAELRELPAASIVAFLECYGNGRKRFAEQGRQAEGIPWRNGAIGNAEWTGVPVAVLLERAGVRPGAVQAECRGGAHDFVRGVEVAKLLDDAIVAYAMNGQDLPVAHGGPVRLVVPGWGGINWVKWIVDMTVLDHESLSPYNQQSYVLIDQDGHVQGKAREVRVKSMIVDPRPDQPLAAGAYALRGVAWSPHGIAGVEVSIDGGARWQPAALMDDLGSRAWRQFVWSWDAAPGEYLLASRATDLAGNVQPVEVPFNQKGYLMNAIEFVPVRVV
ncbi:MAG TPA: sulfite oxidase [Roseiflexaceae bacterium]|nr:sulfite oxidase [Roseiflexaceae bacterium]